MAPADSGPDLIPTLGTGCSAFNENFDYTGSLVSAASPHFQDDRGDEINSDGAVYESAARAEAEQHAFESAFDRCRDDLSLRYKSYFQEELAKVSPDRASLGEVTVAIEDLPSETIGDWAHVYRVSFTVNGPAAKSGLTGKIDWVLSRDGPVVGRGTYLYLGQFDERVNAALTGLLADRLSKAGKPLTR